MAAESGEGAFKRAVAQQTGILPKRDRTLPPQLEQEVLDHLAGRRRFRAVDLSGLTPFQQRVLNKTSEIPRGEVRPYGWVAREIGSPGATRAVGTALGHNPIPFLIPCHRVVRSDGSLGEYSGGGPAMKQRVLAFEGVPLEAIR
jgi:O-6-methylguanine DNA methyltransferase